MKVWFCISSYWRSTSEGSRALLILADTEPPTPTVMSDIHKKPKHTVRKDKERDEKPTIDFAWLIGNLIMQMNVTNFSSKIIFCSFCSKKCSRQVIQFNLKRSEGDPKYLLPLLDSEAL